MVVVALDRTVRLAARTAVERGKQCFFRSRFSGRTGNADDFRIDTRPRRTRQIVERFRAVGNPDMRTVRVLLRHSTACTVFECLGQIQVAIAFLAFEREEKRSPFPTSRESNSTPVTLNSIFAFPCIAAAMSVDVHKVMLRAPVFLVCE